MNGEKILKLKIIWRKMMIIKSGDFKKYEFKEFDTLEERINKKKEELNIAIRSERSYDIILKISQELDLLIVDYMRGEQMELLQAINETRELLKKASEQFKQRGQARAKAIRDYNIALATRMIQLKDEGCPATTQKYLAKGTPEVAELEMKMNIADADYDSLKEAIMIYKKDIDFMTKQLELEYRGQVLTVLKLKSRIL